MNKIKNAMYGAASAVVAFAPGLASAAIGVPASPDAPIGVGSNAWGSRGVVNAQSAGTPTGSIIGIIAATMNWLLAILGFIAIIGFVISGILYLTAAGDETQIDKAKTAMKYSIIGVIVALLGFVILQAVNMWLGTSTSF